MATTYKTLEISQNIDKPLEVIKHEGPVLITEAVELLRLKAIYITHGFLTFDGGGSQRLDVKKLTVNDPRTQAGEPTDGYHLGGVTGRLGMVIGSGLQGDFGKIGRGTHDLVIEHAVGNAVAMEEPQAGGGAAGDKHQDGWQVMQAANVTFELLDWYGGPSTNHAGFFCNPQKGDDEDSELITNVVVLGGVMKTKAAGVALGACTGCGVRNMHIEAKFPWRVDSVLTKRPVNENNTFIRTGR